MPSLHLLTRSQRERLNENVLKLFVEFCQTFFNFTLYDYEIEIARELLSSIFVWPHDVYIKMARQSGKTETLTLLIVHFKLPDPANFYRGHSPVQSIRYALDTHKKADVMNTKKLDNFAFTGGSIETDQAIPEPERRKILQEIKAQYGGASNAGKLIMLPKGLKLNKTQESNQDMQFTEGKKLVREEMLANYGVGPEILGITDSQTRANAEAAIFIFMEFGVSPFVMKFNDTLNNDYLPAFPNPAEAEFCYDDPVPENTEEKRLNMEAGFRVGAVTPNEFRKAFGMEPLKKPGMDETYMPVSVMPVGTDPVEPNVPADLAA